MGYQENPDHVPDPTDLSGTLDTSGIYGGGQHETLHGVSNVFVDPWRQPDAEPASESEKVDESQDDSTEDATDDEPDLRAPEVSDESQVKAYDPAEHTAAEVNAYLAEASEEERERVLDAEKAGKNRKSIGQ